MKKLILLGKIQLCCTLSKKSRHLHIKLCEDIPDKYETGTIYIVGDCLRPQYAIFSCPCGCGKIVYLNLNRESHPCWSIVWHFWGAISLSPSIRGITGCKSHFLILKSKVLWCER